jgi:hypothetical protein
MVGQVCAEMKKEKTAIIFHFPIMFYHSPYFYAIHFASDVFAIAQ